MILNYCPECAAPLKKLSNSKFVCRNAHPYWNNGQSTATVVLLRGDQVLFSKRGLEPKKHKYDLPGGFVEFGESAYDAARRELKEETGLIANGLTIIDSAAQLYEENVSACDTVFVAQKWHGQQKPADDIVALEWRPIDFINSPEFAWDYPGLVDKLRILSKE